jgi:type II secretory pathway component PulJ
MIKNQKRTLNNKGFTLMEIMLAVTLLTIAVVAVGAMIIGTKNNTAQSMLDIHSQQQLNNAQHELNENFMTVNGGIKYWVKQNNEPLSTYIVTDSDDGGEYEKLIAFYKIDIRESVLKKTYYLYNREDKILKTATIEDPLINNNEPIDVDTDIDAVIEAIDTWATVAVKIDNLMIDLSKYASSTLITYNINIQQGQHISQTRSVVSPRCTITINEKILTNSFIQGDQEDMLPLGDG